MLIIKEGQDVLGNYKVYPICLVKCPDREKGMMTYLHGYGEKITRPIVMFLIKGDGINILIDPGGSADDLKAYIPFDWVDIEAFETALNRRGVQINDIDMVILTHLHVDHCLGIRRFPQTQIWIQEDELRFAKSPHPIFAAYYPAELYKNISFRMIKGDREIVPGVNLLHVPGHTPGCQAVSVQTPKGRVVISGFCSINENFDPPPEVREKSEVIIPGICTDTQQAYYSALRVKGEADFILPMHEPSLEGCSDSWPR